MDKIEEAKIYIPGADVHDAKATESFPIAADEFLLVDASNVELRGWDKPEIRCVVEKTILSLDSKGVDEDLAGITVVHRKASGKELFGFYKDIAGKPQWKTEWERFQFKDDLDRLGSGVQRDRTSSSSRPETATAQANRGDRGLRATWARVLA